MRSSPYAFIRIISDATSVFAFIGNECYGASIVNNGIGIIPVSKKGTYTIKAYYENKNGEYNQVLTRTTTATITDSNSVVTVSINSPYGDLSFSSTTDEQFANIVSALDNGQLTVDNLQWKVGDTRTVHLPAIPKSENETLNHNVYYLAQPEQDVTFVIQNIGGVTLTNGKECHYVVGLKNCLSEKEKMFPDSSLNKSTWGETIARDWCNNAFRNAIPETLRLCFKQFKCIFVQRNSSTPIIKTSDDYFAFPAEKEVYGEAMQSDAKEAEALIQFEWYKNKNNQYKLLGDNGSTIQWWLRTSGNNHAETYIANMFKFAVYFGDGAVMVNGGTLYGVSPFGCI